MESCLTQNVSIVIKIWKTGHGLIVTRSDVVLINVAVYPITRSRQKRPISSVPPILNRGKIVIIRSRH